MGHWPQWSPVNVTGNTPAEVAYSANCALAAMEPGERHREHTVVTDAVGKAAQPQWSPVNVTGNTRGR